MSSSLVQLLMASLRAAAVSRRSNLNVSERDCFVAENAPRNTCTHCVQCGVTNLHHDHFLRLIRSNFTRTPSPGRGIATRDTIAFASVS